jgi:hypothetical protein
MMTVTPELADHFNMAMTDHPYWSESSWFSWAIPEMGINGSFYNHFRPNMNCMLAGAFMWDASGEHSFDCLYWDWQAMRVLPEGRFGVDYQKYDWTSPWGMSIKVREPLQVYDLTYVREGFRLNLQFRGVSPVHSIDRIEKHGFQNAYNFHFEQPGRISGEVEVDGKSYAVDCFSIRDGSHGPRFLEKVTPGGYTWSTADERTGWHLMAADLNDSRDCTIVGGYLLRDGTIASIVKGNRRVVERIGPRPSVVEVEAEDELGRRVEATGRMTVPSTFTPFPDRGMYWQQFAWNYDGFTGAIGEDQEYYGIQDFRRWNRAGPEAWSRR